MAEWSMAVVLKRHVSPEGTRAQSKRLSGGNLMIRRTIRSLAISLAVSAGLAPTSALLATGNDACALLTKAEIQKETGLMVADATPGKAVPGVLGRCTWE